MCGFLAIIQDAPIIDAGAARRGLQAIAHRGPDAAGEWRERDVFLGHRRLSIIDLATGDQPMQSADGRYVIVFNGEIYNFLELRELLGAEGATFHTQIRYGGDPRRISALGPRCCQAAERHVRVRHLGPSAFVCVRGARPPWHQAAVLGDAQGALIMSSTLEPFGARRVRRTRSRGRARSDDLRLHPHPARFSTACASSSQAVVSNGVGRRIPDIRATGARRRSRTSPPPDERELEALLDRP